MDAFMKKIERLSEMASRRPDPQPLDAAGVMDRIRGLQVEDENVLTLPLRFYLGGVVAAAAVAVVVSSLAISAWTEISSPLPVMESLIDVMEVL